jgi:hypothetical protein
MPTIDQDIQAMRQSVFGHEIRDAIVDAISQLDGRVTAHENDQIDLQLKIVNGHLIYSRTGVVDTNVDFSLRNGHLILETL